MTSFAQTLDVIESLRVDEQEHILEVLQRRLAERRRAAGRRISGTPPPGPEKPRLLRVPHADWPIHVVGEMSSGRSPQLIRW